MHTITFSHNWNGKLFQDNFSDVRLPDPEKFFVGNQLKLRLKDTEMGVVNITAIRTFKFKQISDVLSFLVCGKPAHYLAEVVRRFYGSEVQIGPETELVHIVLNYHLRHIEKQSPHVQEWWRGQIDRFQYRIQPTI